MLNTVLNFRKRDTKEQLIRTNKLVVSNLLLTSLPLSLFFLFFISLFSHTVAAAYGLTLH